jgi:hypothetical protein
MALIQSCPTGMSQDLAAQRHCRKTQIGMRSPISMNEFQKGLVLLLNCPFGTFSTVSTACVFVPEGDLPERDRALALRAVALGRAWILFGGRTRSGSQPRCAKCSTARRACGTPSVRAAVPSVQHHALLGNLLACQNAAWKNKPPRTRPTFINNFDFDNR